MIRARCFTNLDDFKRYEWPEAFVAVPRLGERVQGQGGGMLPQLKVVGVTHAADGKGPYILVELHR